MRKQIIIALTAVLSVAIACFAGGKYYLINNKSSEHIISLELPPFSSDIVLHEGESAYEKFFEVIYENGFSAKNIDFISEDKNVAEVSYSVTDRNRYVCYKVTAENAGETYIYFSADDGKVVSEKIKVVVLPENNADSTYEGGNTQTENSNTVQTGNLYESETTKPTEEVRDEDIISESDEESSFGQVTSSVAEEENSAQKETTQKAAENNKGNTVYVAPTGKRYHYSKSCAGKNAYAVDKSQAISSGKTPCKKCAGG